MNLVFIFIVITVMTSLASCYSYNHDHNGRPKCETQVELDQVNWRNNYDPSSYWRCSQQSIPADEIKCPINMGFDSRIHACVEWRDWRWTAPVDPPTLYFE